MRALKHRDLEATSHCKSIYKTAFINDGSCKHVPIQVPLEHVGKSYFHFDHTFAMQHTLLTDELKVLMVVLFSKLKSSNQEHMNVQSH